MKIVSSIIMLIGLLIGFGTVSMAASAPQYLQALVPIIGAYVLGRALENFSNDNYSMIRLLNQINDGLNPNAKKAENNGAVAKEKAFIHVKPPKKIDGLLNNDKGLILKYNELKTDLKNDELIILIKKPKSLELLKKSEYETNKELHLTSGYSVIDLNT